MYEGLNNSGRTGLIAGGRIQFSPRSVLWTSGNPALDSLVAIEATNVQVMHWTECRTCPANADGLFKHSPSLDRNARDFERQQALNAGQVNNLQAR